MLVESIGVCICVCLCLPSLLWALGNCIAGYVDVDECAVDNGGCGHTATCVNRKNGFDCFDCPEQSHLAMAYPNFAEQSSCETVMTVDCVSALDVDADGFIGADFMALLMTSCTNREKCAAYSTVEVEQPAE